MAGKYLIVATEDELKLPWSEVARNLGYLPLVTGVGGTNVIRALKDLPRDCDLFNVGYACSLYYPVGSVRHIGTVRLLHPNIDFREEVFNTGPYDTVCMTAGDFVLKAKGLPERSVVDMELAYIAAFGFATLQSVKYVSDALNIRQYEHR